MMLKIKKRIKKIGRTKKKRRTRRIMKNMIENV